MTKSLSSRQVIKMVESDGRIFVKAVGDHHHFKHPSKLGKITVTHPVDTVPIGTLRAIYRQADWIGQAGVGPCVSSR
ncbi:MAG: type II toxin-antitoxin system HicA family toxin [Rhizobiaceae bacterium]|nr:type II toxin-antitoxin system HicA family toxin [Rhizobiaceae bacterium]